MHSQMYYEKVRAAQERVPTDKPLIMLNLMRFHAEAEYAVGSSYRACTGRVAYHERYAPAFKEVVAAERIAGIKVLYLGMVEGIFFGPMEEEWDEMALVQYPNFAAFRTIVESPHYQAKADAHRLAALKDWRLIPTTQGRLG